MVMQFSKKSGLKHGFASLLNVPTNLIFEKIYLVSLKKSSIFAIQNEM